jgi:hypothetical protein
MDPPRVYKISVSGKSYFHHFHDSAYFPLATMATSLSALPKLETLFVDFEYPTRYPERRNRPPPPPTLFILPALTELQFQGDSEYFEVLVAHIDAPLLDRSISLSLTCHKRFDSLVTYNGSGHPV